MLIQIDNAKAYATEANLMAGLNRLGLIKNAEENRDQVFIVRRRDGKWTAIFNMNKNVGGYMAVYSQYGFYSH